MRIISKFIKFFVGEALAAIACLVGIAVIFYLLHLALMASPPAKQIAQIALAALFLLFLYGIYRLVLIVGSTGSHFNTRSVKLRALTLIKGALIIAAFPGSVIFLMQMTILIKQIRGEDLGMPYHYPFITLPVVCLCVIGALLISKYKPSDPKDSVFIEDIEKFD